ncbi:cytochrome c maturation protein CcmE [Tatumella sp. TA1]|uniref:cytochrome c maturation protein CcmE n=1 Tax=Rosenbergiella collisarenosi TaxID=1544695 RepID=UPI0008F8003C|nr:cytochrome c maturation protein CcmE [Rosenbergiella collisarenosi]MBT0720480.1 cytochrome c maturation protein CcmE [Rosenbergiella collisarenosi]QGX91882.1 cytochrome c maturation protein CcmE [Tatumella sp. TA1]
MNLRRRKRLITVLAIVVGLGIATALVMYALRSNIDLFYTPSEIINGKGEDHQIPEPGQRLRVGGMVMPGSVKRDPTTLAVSFKLYDANGVVSVSYVGILPDLFREGQGVVAQGVLTSNRLITAQQVLAKHDEKYTPPEIEDAMKKNHQQAGVTKVGSDS